MTTRAADQDEIVARLATIADGPWKEAAKKAYKFLDPPVWPDEHLRSSKILNLMNIGKRPSDRVRLAKISRVLRAHWEEPIIDSTERAIRDSFDEALTTFQLWELAVESGYLPVEAVRLPARRAFASLLWSEGARAFIDIYGYATVFLLASRVGVQLSPTQKTPPAPLMGGGQRFASFLAEIRAWYTDEALTKWLAFLDDYRDIPNAGKQLKRLLGGQAPEPNYIAYLGTLLGGAQTFRLRLSDFAGTLEPSERPLYGSFFAYWLARFHGFRAGREGYRRAKTNWSKELARAFEGDETQQYITYILQSFWHETLMFLQPSNSRSSQQFGGEKIMIEAAQRPAAR